MPRYSNGARVLGDITLYAQLKSIDAKPPKIPTSIKRSQSKLFSTPENSDVEKRITIEPKYEKFIEQKLIFTLDIFSGINFKTIFEIKAIKKSF